MPLAKAALAEPNLRDLIKDQFKEFNQSIPPGVRRRFPKPLKDLLCRARASGISPMELAKLTGLCRSTIYTIIKAGAAAASQPAPRRLEVVHCIPDPTPKSLEKPKPLIVRLPSGVTLELEGEAQLTTSLLGKLARLEAIHVTSC